MKRDVEPEHYFGVPLLTQAMEEAATEDQWRRINDDDRYRFEPWTGTLP